MKTLLIALISSIFLLGCKPNLDGVTASGNVITYDIPIKDYSKINLSGPFDLIYEQKAMHKPYLKIEINESFKPYVDISVKNNTLYVDLKRNNFRMTRYKIYTNSSELAGIKGSGSGDIVLKGNVTSPNLDISLSGSGNIKTDRLKCTNLKVSVTGSGWATLEGEALNAKLDISGSGSMNANKLKCTNVTCKISGSGSARVYATDQLIADISGSGAISYKGSPKHLDNRVSGSGKVKAE